MSHLPKIRITPEDLESVAPAGPGNSGDKLVIMLDSDGNRPKRSGSLWVVFVAGVVGVAAGILAAAYWPRADWVRAIDQATDRGVVLIQVDAKGLLSQVK